MENFDDEFEFDEAELKRRIQDCNDGFTYEMIELDGEIAFKCNKCGRSAPLHDRPFPHKLNCEMLKRFGR